MKLLLLTHLLLMQNGYGIQIAPFNSIQRIDSRPFVD